jgi:hypothetical protein
MSESEIPDEMLVDLLRGRGYDVTKRDEPNLSDKIDTIGTKLDALREEPRSPEEEQQYRLAEQLRDHMNRSLGHWYGPGGSDAA